MSISRKARWIALLAALSAGTALQVGNNGCAQYYLTGGLGALDFCSVFNCTAGSYFNFCSPTRIFVDCPAAATTP